MKQIFITLVSIFILTISDLSAQNCINCNNPFPLSDTLYRSKVGFNNIVNGHYAFAAGENSTADGNRSFAFGFNTQALGNTSFSFGNSCISYGLMSFSLGMASEATGDASFAIGSKVKSRYTRSFAIGSGPATGMMENLYMETMMIGFNSVKPTLFISRPKNDVSPYDKTGKVAIGDITRLGGEPLAKLHILADDGEEAAIFIEPYNWSAGEAGKIILGDTNHFIKTSKSIGMEFTSSSNFVFNGNNSGFGVEEPKAKVHINGDLLFEQSLNGIIMKSEDGNCWKGTISNNGELIFSQVDCETLSSTENITETKHSEIFIYPNPTNGQITVEYTGNRKNLRLELKSISGHLVATYKIKKGENRIELNNISDQMIIASVFTKKGELISTNKVVIKK